MLGGGGGGRVQVKLENGKMFLFNFKDTHQPEHDIKYACVFNWA